MKASDKPKAKTGAQRQAAYRARAKDRYEVGARLDLRISKGEKTALVRLVRCYRVTGSEMLGRLIIAADNAARTKVEAKRFSRLDYRDGLAHLDIDKDL